jgi:hypothetical protein
MVTHTVPFVHTTSGGRLTPNRSQPLDLHLGRAFVGVVGGGHRHRRALQAWSARRGAKVGCDLLRVGPWRGVPGLHRCGRSIGLAARSGSEPNGPDQQSSTILRFRIRILSLTRFLSRPHTGGRSVTGEAVSPRASLARRPEPLPARAPACAAPPGSPGTFEHQ